MAFVKGKKKTAGKAAPAKKKNPLPTFQAPEDFKAHFLAVQFTTGPDGIAQGTMKFTRFKGKFDLAAPDKKKLDMMSYDPQTCLAITARLSAKAFSKSTPKMMPVSRKERSGLKGAHRLPPSTSFLVVLRAGFKKADNSLTCRIRHVLQLVATKSGKLKPVELEKADPAYRLIRGASRILPGAFINSTEPPKKERRTKEEE